jgi:prophage regulatory protein
MQVEKTSGFYRLWDIIGNPKLNIKGIIPVSRSTWFAGVKSGRFPKSVKLSARCSAWRIEDIEALVIKLGNNNRLNC